MLNSFFAFLKKYSETHAKRSLRRPNVSFGIDDTEDFVSMWADDEFRKRIKFVLCFQTKQNTSKKSSFRLWRIVYFILFRQNKDYTLWKQFVWDLNVVLVSIKDFRCSLHCSSTYISYIIVWNRFETSNIKKISYTSDISRFYCNPERFCFKKKMWFLFSWQKPVIRSQRYWTWFTTNAINISISIIIIIISISISIIITSIDVHTAKMRPFAAHPCRSHLNKSINLLGLQNKKSKKKRIWVITKDSHHYRHHHRPMMKTMMICLN